MSTSHAGALFDKVRAGDSAARDVLYENCFARLHLIAASLLSRECRGHTLQPTALVGELFFKLRGFEHRILNEDHFFGMAARAMRQVLIDHARVRNSRRKVAAEAIPEMLSQRSAADAELWLGGTSCAWRSDPAAKQAKGQPGGQSFSHDILSLPHPYILKSGANGDDGLSDTRFWR